ncbi:MAG TPA: transporter [Cyanobacteria bacterium UBA8803]|nr:transporter [Cyanobacteria bacterium UBA9273]HBL59850.1 transporter [Cyanobacteria bacterium UBA8803]
MQPLLQLYMQLGGGMLLGWILGRSLPQQVPMWIGQFLFWIGVPVSIITFLRGAELSGTIWIAPVVAWVAILLGAGLAWAWIRSSLSLYNSKTWSKPSQGSFLLASMVGNTGYLGFPVSLTLVGEKYFGWALFYDLLGSLLGAYGLGVLLAARFGRGTGSQWQLVKAIALNPALWCLGVGLVFRQTPLPELAEQGLKGFAWSTIALSLILIGMRLSQLASWRKLRQAALSLGIKMLLVPLVLGIGLLQLGFKGSPQLVMVLQMSMPPAFATLVIAEVYDLDRELAVTALAVGVGGLLLTLPIWLLLFTRN